MYARKILYILPFLVPPYFVKFYFIYEKILYSSFKSTIIIALYPPQRVLISQENWGKYH